MRFLSNGDFLLPLQFTTYLAQHIYTWSYERGAPNPDGILRLPGRLVDIVVFGLVGNVGFGYFYLATCLLIAFVSFLWFARSFLDAQRWGIALLGAAFFACNPIFLGNLSKVGLVLAVSMLPLALTAIRQGFLQKRFSYFLLAILALNISLVHPFTFAVNLLVCACFVVLTVKKERTFVRDNAWKFGLLAVTTLLLNAYCILPLVSLRTIDKSALADTVAAAPVDYTSLVDVANTGDIFTGLSLSKGVLKDYEFYGAMTWPFYFLGVFALYALLFGVYVQVEKRAKPHERRRFVLLLGTFLGLLVLATASYMYAGVLIKLLVGLPGGWIFRSPLKWQLYMPLVLFAAVVIALKYVRGGWRLKVLYAAFGLCFVLMNGYLFKEIYAKLLVPRSLTAFSELQAVDMRGKNLLFVDSGTCMGFARDNPALATELNQVLISKPVQVKHVQAGAIDTLNLAGYDFVMGCSGTLSKPLLSSDYAFSRAKTFAGMYQLYTNTRPQHYVGGATHVFALDEPKNVSGKYALATNLNQPFSFIIGEQATVPTTGLQDLFDNLGPAGLRGGLVHSSVAPLTQGRQQLFIRDGQPVYFALDGDRLQLSAASEPGLKLAPPKVPMTAQALEVTYRDPSLTYQNEIVNGSLERGLWQPKVGDCNAYDDKAALGMRLNKNQKTDGNQALELVAQNHIACTGPSDVPVTEGAHYLLAFDYQTDGGQYAGYYAGYDNLEQTSTGARLADSRSAWQSFSTELIAPPGATRLHLMVYAYAASLPGRTGLARYDNFRLIRIPNITNRFFVVGEQTAPAGPPKVSFNKLNPTKTLIQINGASSGFYLTTKETYSRQWQLTAGGQELPGHVRLNGTTNGWYVDTEEWCRYRCKPNADGTYDLELTMEFAPQRWFYIGSITSTVTAGGALGYVAFDIWRARRQRRKQ